MHLGERMGLKMDVERLQRNWKKQRKNKSTKKAVTSVEAF